MSEPVRLVDDEHLSMALQCAEDKDATHWPTVAGILADAYRAAKRERDEKQETFEQMKNSVTVVCSLLPNVAEYIRQVEDELVTIRAASREMEMTLAKAVEVIRLARAGLKANENTREGSEALNRASIATSNFLIALKP